MKTKLMAAAIIFTLIFSFSNPVSAKKYVLKLGILSAAGGLEDQAVRKIAEVAAEKSNGEL